MVVRIFTSYVKNTLVAGVFFLPIVAYSDRAWTTEDTAAFIILGWLLGGMISALFSAFKITSKEAKEMLLKEKEDK